MLSAQKYPAVAGKEEQEFNCTLIRIEFVSTLAMGKLAVSFSFRPCAALDSNRRRLYPQDVRNTLTMQYLNEPRLIGLCLLSSNITHSITHPPGLLGRPAISNRTRATTEASG